MQRCPTNGDSTITTGAQELQGRCWPDFAVSKNSKNSSNSKSSSASSSASSDGKSSDGKSSDYKSRDYKCRAARSSATSNSVTGISIRVDTATSENVAPVDLIMAKIDSNRILIHADGRGFGVIEQSITNDGVRKYRYSVVSGLRPQGNKQISWSVLN